MSLDELRNKRLILVSGKGGVGKTTVSAALAWRFAQEGHRVLLAEINSQEQVAALFGVEPTGYREARIRKNLYGLNVVPMRAFEEYVVLQIKFRSIYAAVFDNKFVRFFIEAAPGLAELMSIGKIYSLLDNYDRIIVDAPATGHGMSLLQIPTVVSSAVRVGPLKHHSESIEKLLRDRERTALTIVTLPEEMPVAETLELEEWAQQHLGIGIGPVFLNGVTAPFLTPAERGRVEDFFAKQDRDSLAGLAVSYRMRTERAAMSEHYRNLLQQKLPAATLCSIPFFSSGEIGETELERIGEALDA